MEFNIGQAIERLKQGLTGEIKDERLQSLYQRVDDQRGLRIITYPGAWTYQFRAGDWTPEMRIARGIVFDSEWNVVSLPLIKFFNYNELMVDVDTPFVVMEKCDGVMVQLFYYRDEPIFATRHGIETPPALLAKSLLEPYLEEFCQQVPFRPFTAVFELYAPEFRQPGMLYYGKQPFLTLLGIRDLNNLFYPYYPARRVFKDDQLFDNLYVVQEHGQKRVYEIVSESVHPDNQREGYVAYCLSNPELMIKFKTYWYIDRLSRVRRLTYKRFLKLYEQEGKAAVDRLIAENQDILDDIPLLAWYRDLEEAIREMETKVERYSRYTDVNQIPFYCRWIYCYKYDPEKFERKFRQNVVNILQDR